MPFKDKHFFVCVKQWQMIAAFLCFYGSQKINNSRFVAHNTHCFAVM